MFVLLPKFRDHRANYFFVVDARGSIVRVVFPCGDQFLRVGESD
jgi:hypothetical protein